MDPFVHDRSQHRGSQHNRSQNNRSQNNRSQHDDVPLRFAKALLVQAHAFGKDVDAVIEAAGFPFNPLDQATTEDACVTIEQYSRLCMELFEVLQDEAGGIIQGVQTPIGSSRMLTYSMIHCQNLRQAMERAIEFNAVCRERAGSIQCHELQLSEDRKVVTLNYLSMLNESVDSRAGESAAATDLPVLDAQAQDGVLCSMAVWMRVCSWFIGKNIEVLAAGCASAVPDNRDGLQHFFPCPIVFDQATNWVSFSATHLEAPIVRSEDDLEEFLKVAPYHAVIEPVKNEKSVSARIRVLIGDDFRTELPTFDQLTGMLNMSARTLRRRLDKEGTSYQRIKDGARRDAAIEFLTNPGLTVSDVAELVGFSDPSAFHRSFKRWTGLSPGSYR